MAFANAALPLAALADTAVISLAGEAAQIGGVGLGLVAYSPVYWSFYFLRMGTTGLAAQAAGAGEEARLQRILVRGIACALLFGALARAASALISAVVFGLLQGSEAVETAGRAYFAARMWGAPAALATFALTGWLIGIGRTRPMLATYGVMSAVNVALDLWFVLGLGMGPGGVGAATAIAEWVGALTAAGFVLHAIAVRGGWRAETFLWSRLSDLAALSRLFTVSASLFVRSAALVFGFAWFQNGGARMGDTVIAADQILLQFVSFWAFVLDAFAFTAEAEVGGAIGRGSRADFRRAVRVTSELALACGVVFAAITMLAGPGIIEAIVRDAAVRAQALALLPWCAAIPAIGVAAWQFDGIFIGATRSRTMAVAAVAAAGLYIACDFVLRPAFGVHGLWAAFLLYYVFRAATLAAAYPKLERSLA
jgi:MATE family multidrug resistance protein